MSSYSLSHLPDPVLLHDLAALVARERATTAALLAHLAEVDARRLYLPAAHPSMYSYCVHELGFSEDAAFKRIRAARIAYRCPAVFAAVAEGRVHLSAVVLLAPHLTPENVEELLAAAATRKSKAGIERLLAERFPRPDLPERVEVLAPPLARTLPSAPPAPGRIEAPASTGQLAPGPVEQRTVVEAPAQRPKVTPLSPGRFALQLTIGQATHEKLRYAQALLGHQLPAGELAEVLDRALDALIGQLERRKFAATAKPRPRTRRSSANPRHIPAHVKRAVWERDGGRCTFVSEAGRRCPARTRLEFDHADPVSRGGEATAERMRLRCRAHNQYAAECTFGAGFMSHKREAAREAAAARTRAAAEEARARAAAAEVIPWLRGLGFRADEARRAAARCQSVPDAPLEERVRVALSCFAKAPLARAASSLPAPT
ncbi:MAG: hypothetical protein HZC42_13065 [Candidatus Eisenbacteria bacterium]|nr:hypothetical protein [Candidatus Eisenbacteria bacterium]